MLTSCVHIAISGVNTNLFSGVRSISPSKEQDEKCWGSLPSLRSGGGLAPEVFKSCLLYILVLFGLISLCWRKDTLTPVVFLNYNFSPYTCPGSTPLLASPSEAGSTEGSGDGVPIWGLSPWKDFNFTCKSVHFGAFLASFVQRWGTKRNSRRSTFYWGHFPLASLSELTLLIATTHRRLSIEQEH